MSQVAPKLRKGSTEPELKEILLRLAEEAEAEGNLDLAVKCYEKAYATEADDATDSMESYNDLVRFATEADRRGND